MLRQGNALLIVIDIQEKLVPAMNGLEGLISACERLIRGCDILGVPVLVSEQYPKGLGPTIHRIAETFPASGHTVIEKTSFSVMGEPEFAKALESAKFNAFSDIIVCGIESHVCVQQSALDLLDAGYNVFIAADAVSSRSPEDREFAMRRMEAAGAVVTTAETILFELLGGAKNPVFKDISKLVK